MSSSDHYGLLVTFEGPFDVTSNKHFASWAGAATATAFGADRDAVYAKATAASVETLTAALAKAAGYDGVEVMGSEGYLINQFICERTNQRSDGWGGSRSAGTDVPSSSCNALRSCAH